MRAVVGIEQEFSVLDRDNSVDFRTVIHELGLAQPHLDPDDPHAYRLANGSVITRDGAEAEIASPPIVIARGFAAAARSWAARETADLAGRLPKPLRLEGFSTHISVEVPEHLERQVAATYVTRFAAGMLTAMDGPEAPGIRVRPRHRRLELCGDYVEGQRLSEAVEYAAGSVAACVAAINGVAGRDDLPRPVRTLLRPAIERPGWFINMAAMGVASEAQPRITFEGSDSVSLAGHVAALRATARAALGRWVVDTGGSQAGVGPVDQVAGTPFSRVLGTRTRPGFALAPVMVTWPLVLFIVAESAGIRSSKPAFIAVPRDWLSSFLDKLDRGFLDTTLRDHLAARPRAEIRGQIRAASWADVSVPGLFDAVPSRVALLPAEPG